jgi:hypothetical protein
MKKILFILSLLSSMSFFGQTKKLEVTHKETGKQIFFESDQRVKMSTLDRKKLVGSLTIIDLQTLSVNGTEVKIDNISSIKYFPKRGRTAKNIFLGTGAGLVVSSGIAGIANSESAFSLFLGGTASIITGALLNNKHKTLIYRHYMFKIIE